MPVTRADHEIRKATWDILTRFLNEYDWTAGPLATLRDKVYETYYPSQVESSSLYWELCKSDDVNLRDQHRFLYLDPTDDQKVLPIVTLQSSSRWVHFRVYTLLTKLDDNDDLQSLAIRFETDEGEGGGSHDFCHAQLCVDIDSALNSIAPTWLPTSQPSFPIDADNQIGLVLCMLTSLYGGRRVLDKLNVSGDTFLRDHMRRIRALDSIA